MIKKTITLLSVLILSVMMIFYASAESVMLGDINQDGHITAADARLALRFAASLEIPTDAQFASADVNKNGAVNAADARIILRVAAGLEKLSDNETPPENALPDEIQLLLSGEYSIIETHTDEYDSTMTITINVSGKNALYSLVLKDHFSNETLISENGNCYMVDTKKLLATQEESTENFATYADGTFLLMLIELSEKKPDFYISTELMGEDEFTVYTHAGDYGTLKLYMFDEKLAYIIPYDKEMYQLCASVPNEIRSDFDKTKLDINNYKILSEDEFYKEVYGEDFDFDYDDHLTDEYWTDNIDWDSIEAVTVTDKSQLPEEYYLAASDTYACECFSRSPSDESFEILADGDYVYTETLIFRTNDFFLSQDPYFTEFSYLMKFSEDSKGNEYSTTYLIYQSSNSDTQIYAELDEILAASMGLTYEDYANFTRNATKLIEDREHTVEIRETTVNGVKYKKISCIYDDYTSDLFFVNGEFIRIEDTMADGTYAGTMLIYNYTTELNTEELNLEDFEKVGSLKFFSIIIGDMTEW